MSYSELLAGVRAKNENSARMIDSTEPLVEQLENSLMTLEATPYGSRARAAWSDAVARDTARLVLAMARG